MANPDPKRVAAAYLVAISGDQGSDPNPQGFAKNAGEVIFKKDRGGDATQWAYADHAPSKRDIPGDFNYSPKNQKPLATVLLSTLAALGHILSAHNAFAKIKSARVSPDGNLGGRGYIMKIADMRKQYMNCVEALSALSDTLYDEVNAPHWSVFSRQEAPEDQAAVSALLSDAEAIRRDPEDWAEDTLEEEFGEEVEEDGEDGPEETEDSEEEFDHGGVFGEPESYDDEGSWGLWEEEEEDAPMGKTARTSARSIRLALRAERIAYDWLARNGDEPVGLFPEMMPAELLPPEGFDPGQMALDPEEIFLVDQPDACPCADGDQH